MIKLLAIAAGLLIIIFTLALPDKQSVVPKQQAAYAPHRYVVEENYIRPDSYPWTEVLVDLGQGLEYRLKHGGE